MSTFKVSGVLSLDGRNFAAGLSRAEIGAKRFASTITREIGNRLAGLFALGAVEELGRKIIRTGKELVVASQRMGLSVEQLQILKQAAKDSNVELDRMASAFEKLDIAREKALSGTPEGDKLLGSFAALGVSEQDLRTKTAAQLSLGPIAATLHSKNPEDLAGSLRDVFGRAFGEIIPVLKTDFDELGARMRSVGAIMTDETAVTLKYLADEAELLGSVLISKIAPALVWFAEKLVETAAVISSAFAYLGGLTNRIGAKDLGRLAIPLYGQTFGVKAIIDKLSHSEGKKAAEDVAMQWIALLNDVKEEMARRADELKHPKAPTFQYRESSEDVKPGHIRSSDSLIAVGNFLGAARDPMARIAERQLTTLQNIEKEGAHQSEILKGMATYLANSSMSLGLSDL